MHKHAPKCLAFFERGGETFFSRRKKVFSTPRNFHLLSKIGDEGGDGADEGGERGDGGDVTGEEGEDAASGGGTGFEELGPDLAADLGRHQDLDGRSLLKFRVDLILRHVEGVQFCRQGMPGRGQFQTVGGVGMDRGRDAVGIAGTDPAQAAEFPPPGPLPEGGAGAVEKQDVPAPLAVSPKGLFGPLPGMGNAAGRADHVEDEQGALRLPASGLEKSPVVFLKAYPLLQFLRQVLEKNAPGVLAVMVVGKKTDHLFTASPRSVVSGTMLKNSCLRAKPTLPVSSIWAFFYNALGIPLAAGVFHPLFGWKLVPALGALAMACSSLCVVLNALRLTRFAPGKLPGER